MTWNLGWVLYSVQYARYGTITLARNGLLLANVGSSGQYSGPQNFVFNWGAYSDQRSEFHLADLAVYDRRLNDTERVFVEAALLWKYGLQASLPASHPYASMPPAIPSLTSTPSFTPTASPTFSLGASQSPTSTPSPTGSASPTVVPLPWTPAHLDGGSPADVWLAPEALGQLAAAAPILTWPNAAPPGSVYDALPQFGRPPFVTLGAVNGLPVASFVSPGAYGAGASLSTPVNYAGSTTAGTPPRPGGYTLFLVYRMTGTAQRVLTQGWPAVGSDWIWPTHGWSGFHNDVLLSSAPGPGWVNYASTWAPISDWVIQSLTYDGTGTHTARGHTYGTQTYSASVDPSWTQPNGFRFGGGYATMLSYGGNNGASDTEFSSCDIAEFMAFPRALNDTERVLVEGYLAWKFGLSAHLPTGHTFAASAPASLPSLTSTPTATSSATPSSSPTQSRSPTLSLGASPTPTLTQSPGYSGLCPNDGGRAWVHPPGSDRCFALAPASLLPSAAAAGGLAFADAAPACAALSAAAVPASVRSAADASFVVRARCGEAAFAVADDGFGLWLGLRAAAGAMTGTPRNASSGWAWTAPGATATAFLQQQSPDGGTSSLWGLNEPSGPVTTDDSDAACVHVSSGGSLDDIQCWVTLLAACCEVPLTTPSLTSSPSPSSAHTASATPTGSSSGTTSPSQTPTPSPSHTGTPTHSPSATATPTSSSSGTPFCKPESFASAPYFSLDGVVLGVAVQQGAQSSMPSAAACQLACCQQTGCTGYSISSLPSSPEGSGGGGTPSAPCTQT